MPPSLLFGEPHLDAGHLRSASVLRLLAACGGEKKKGRKALS
jgi:hypothetical protein